jgi:hypothetical protein
MWNPFNLLFRPPLAAPPIEADAKRWGHLPPRDGVESIEEKSKRLDWRNLNLPKSKSRYLRLADLPSTIEAEAADPWRVDPNGVEWVRVPSASQDVVADDDDEMAAAIAEIDAQMAADDAASKAKFARLRAEAAERDSFLPYQDWTGDDE